MNKVKFVDKSRLSKCWHCNGTGIENIEAIKNITRVPECNICKGTGKWKEEFYHLIYTDKNGQKICFGVDSLK